MEFIEILQKLKEGANFELKFENGEFDGYGAINKFDECKLDSGHTQYWYDYVHYPEKKKILESIVWNVVENPRNPKPEEYPSEDGDYITMLDCDEHAVWHNVFRNGGWLIYNRTHVKWWIKIPNDFVINSIEY
jgi:hypothetical protein